MISLQISSILFLVLKQCKVEKEDDQLILAFLSKLRADYSVFFSTFYAGKLTTLGWKMPTLNAFIESLTNEHYKLIQMASSVPLLTPYNFHTWKIKMELQLYSKGLFIITMETEVEPGSAIEKSIFLNKKDEAFGFLCLSISEDLLFHLTDLKTPKQIWDKIKKLSYCSHFMEKFVKKACS